MSKKESIKQAIHFIDNWLDYQTYIKEIPGVAFGIFVEDEIIFKKEYGYAKLEGKVKLTDQHLFRIASHSKLFTATAIMKLYYEEKLSLDDKVSKYLSWFSSEKDKNLEHIRIRHLLTHSSGMTRDGNTAHWNIHSFPELGQIKKQIIEGISFFDTDVTFKYSNFAFTLLGQIIEVVSGKSYEEYIQEIILNPLEMKNTVVDVNEENMSRHATGHNRKLPEQDRGEFKHIPAKVMHAATGLSSTVEDLIKFYKAHMFGNKTLFPDYIKREMQRLQFKSKDTDWGLGFALRSIPKDKDNKMVGHGGGYPGFITQSGLIQDQKIIIIVLTNAVDGPAKTLITGILEILSHLKEKKEKYTIKKDEQIPNFKDIIGFYATEWGTSFFSQIGQKLVGSAPGDDNPVETLQIYKHIEGYKFKAPKNLPFASPGQHIKFIDGPDGEKIFVDSHGGKIKRFYFKY